MERDDNHDDYDLNIPADVPLKRVSIKIPVGSDICVVLARLGEDMWCASRLTLTGTRSALQVALDILPAAEKEN